MAEAVLARIKALGDTDPTPTRRWSKPVDFEQFTAAIRQIDDFFLRLVQLPH
jgi:hypothetical protein